MTDAAADTLLSNSTASLGSIGSTQRSEMPALNPASARSRIASRLREASLGRKPLDSPAASASRIKQAVVQRSEEHTSELQSPCNLVCRLLLEKKKKLQIYTHIERVRNNSGHVSACAMPVAHTSPHHLPQLL